MTRTEAESLVQRPLQWSGERCDSLGANGGGGGTWSDSGFILKVNLTGFANGFDVACE